MAKPKPCKHSRRAVVKFEAVKVQLDESGVLVAWGNTPDMNLWGVIEDRRCARCGHVGLFFARKGFGEATERKALSRYGVKTGGLPPPPNYKPKAEPIAAPLTCWPFPVSSRKELTR